MVGGGRPSTTLGRSALPVVDGRPPPTMTLKGECLTPLTRPEASKNTPCGLRVVGRQPAMREVWIGLHPPPPTMTLKGRRLTPNDSFIPSESLRQPPSCFVPGGAEI